MNEYQSARSSTHKRVHVNHKDFSPIGARAVVRLITFKTHDLTSTK